MSGKFLLLLKSKNVVHIICSAHLKRVSVVEHNGHDKNGDICFEKKNDYPGIFPFFASPAARKTAMETVYFTTFVERAEIGII